MARIPQMALCTDTLIHHLSRCGYCPVFPPRVGLTPLETIGENANGLTELGPITSLWRSGSPSPRVITPEPASEINGRCTSWLAPSIGMTYLASALDALGASQPECCAMAYRGTRAVQFSFGNAQSLSVPLAELRNYLRTGDLSSSDPFASSYFLHPHLRVHIIHEVLISDSLSVVPMSNRSHSLVDLRALRRYVGPKVELKSASNFARSVTYVGQIPLTFAFKAMELAFVLGEWGLTGSDNALTNRASAVGTVVLKTVR